MNADLCALTDEMLPLYTEGLLPMATRQLMDEHATHCPACRARLDRAAATLAPTPEGQAGRDKRGRELLGRTRRVLLYGLVSIMTLLIAAGGLRYAGDRTSPAIRELIPARVANADEVASRAIPDWGRAKADGLVVAVGITEQIPGTDATITLDQAWYSGRQGYIIYTVKAPKGGYVMPTRVSLGNADSEDSWTEGNSDWEPLSQWSGFSSEGFHSVISFPALSLPANTQQLKVIVMQWARVTPEAGLDERQNPGNPLSLLLPWRTAYLEESAPYVKGHHREQTWLGRKLLVEDLYVGIGRIKLTGRIGLPTGERNPSLMADLQVGDETLRMKEFTAEPIAGTLWSEFTATFDGPTAWPAPVTLAIKGIGFETDRTLEWPVNWAKYRVMPDSKMRPMAAADQVSVQFYDSVQISTATSYSGVIFEQEEATWVPPYVRAAIGTGAGRGARGDRPGMEVVNSKGEVLTNLGGGGSGANDAHGNEQ